MCRKTTSRLLDGVLRLQSRTSPLLSGCSAPCTETGKEYRKTTGRRYGGGTLPPIKVMRLRRLGSG